MKLSSSERTFELERIDSDPKNMTVIAVAGFCTKVRNLTQKSLFFLEPHCLGGFLANIFVMYAFSLASIHRQVAGSAMKYHDRECTSSAITWCNAMYS